ncbi:MAG: NNP family nitrate/nitrite transporter-like MFS transporter [Gammaproteobacteria bacterium]|jgi:NNP family nitrate/nitrite transporter-like MFS transporter
MNGQGAVTRGQQNTALGMSTLAFTVCFAVWTIFSIIGVRIKEDLGLSDTQFGLLAGTPILTGSLSRIFLGIWTDQYGGRIVYVTTMVLAAVATFVLSLASTYEMMLLAALGLGLAGGSFAVGIAYVSKWYPSEKQGTALGIFGAGNVGAAVTKFTAPFVLLAFGWQTVAQVWAAALIVMAVVFWLTTEDDPELQQRKRTGTRARGALLQLAPLKYPQVWRFAIYYFFVFGAFVALALWLPRYLVGVYDLDIATAGVLAAFYSVPASLFRAYGGFLSDRFGARAIMYWTFSVSALCCFLLSYPDTQYAVRGIEGPISFQINMGLVPFVGLVFVLGFFMSLGKAAVYKHIPVYYPEHIGSVGGLVGMIGGLGGFILPIAFGALNDLTGVATSCFMLLFVLVVIALFWMHFTIGRMEKSAAFGALKGLPELPELVRVHGPEHQGALGPRSARFSEKCVHIERREHPIPQNIERQISMAARHRRPSTEQLR